MPGVDDLFDSLSERVEELARDICSQIRVEVPGYERVGEAEHLRDVRAQITTILTGLRSRRPPPPAAIEQIRELGRRRAASHLALPDLVEAYHIAYREIWNELLCAAEDYPELTAQLASEVALVWSWFHRLTGAVTDAHAAETRERAAARVSLRRRFVEALASEDEDCEALATALGFSPGGEFVAASTGPLDEQAVDRIDADFAVRGVPALAVAEQGRGLLIGQSPANLVTAVRSHDSDVRIGLGLTRHGLTGAAASVQDARDAVELALALDRDVSFADDWHAAILHAARARLAAVVNLGTVVAAKHPGLADAVRAYGDSGFSVAGCARLLDIHPNTAKYRLQRWRELTGWDVQSLADLTASMVCLDTLRQQ